MQQLPFTRDPGPSFFTIPLLGVVSLGQYRRPDSNLVFFSAAEITAALAKLNKGNEAVGNPVPAFLRSGSCKDAVEYLEDLTLEDRRLSVPATVLAKYAAQDPFGRYFFCAELSSALILYINARVGLGILSPSGGGQADDFCPSEEDDDEGAS